MPDRTAGQSERRDEDDAEIGLLWLMGLIAVAVIVLFVLSVTGNV